MTKPTPKTFSDHRKSSKENEGSKNVLSRPGDEVPNNHGHEPNVKPARKKQKSSQDDTKHVNEPQGVFLPMEVVSSSGACRAVDDGSSGPKDVAKAPAVRVKQEGKASSKPIKQETKIKQEDDWPKIKQEDDSSDDDASICTEGAVAPPHVSKEKSKNKEGSEQQQGADVMTATTETPVEAATATADESFEEKDADDSEAVPAPPESPTPNADLEKWLSTWDVSEPIPDEMLQIVHGAISTWDGKITFPPDALAFVKAFLSKRDEKAPLSAQMRELDGQIMKRWNSLYEQPQEVFDWINMVAKQLQQENRKVYKKEHAAKQRKTATAWMPVVWNQRSWIPNGAVVPELAPGVPPPPPPAMFPALAQSPTAWILVTLTQDGWCHKSKPQVWSQGLLIPIEDPVVP